MDAKFEKVKKESQICLMPVSKSGYQKTQKFTQISEQNSLKKLHKRLAEKLCQQKSKGKLQFFHFLANDQENGWVIPFLGKKVFTLSKDLKSA
jgi:hypothetical protein